ncbi:hypothetical protein IFM89_015869 [Coptis chinensis]|uniref:F-box associated beta-propeller type 3 domain-containing protein n=1 Tax=Coptis chinensis TaxID=261450 RepID=A0A835IRM8_9MAGN|nr:hypothetical protein IFM89_015869 [Coptis chinensis]
MDGTFYWYSTDKESVISFNLADEKFGVIQGPRRIERGLDRMVMNLFELEGCLCLVDYHYLGRDQSRKRILDLWMSKDFKCGEWVLMTSIALPQEAMSLEIPCCTQPGEIVLAKSSDRSRVLYLYSILTRKLNKMKVDGVPLTFGDPLSCLVTNHVENFVSLKNL